MLALTAWIHQNIKLLDVSLSYFIDSIFFSCSLFFVFLSCMCFSYLTRRLRRRSLHLPTRSKSAQTGHLCTTAQAGADPGIFVCRSKFPGLKVGRRSWLANKALQSSTWNKFKKEQYHSFSACVDTGYNIKESITDILRDIQQTMQ